MLKKIAWIAASLILLSFSAFTQSTDNAQGVEFNLFSLQNDAINPNQYSMVLLGHSIAGDMPPLTYSLLANNCPAADNISQVQVISQGYPQGYCWQLVIPSNGVDVRAFGANTTNADNTAAFETALAWSGANKTCVLIPNTITTPFEFTQPLNIGASADLGCLKGNYTASSGSNVPPLFTMLQWSNDTDGIVVNGTRNLTLENFSFSGNAAESNVATITHGLTLQDAPEAHFSGLYEQDWVVDNLIAGGTGRANYNNIYVSDQNRYPNVLNGFPSRCFLFQGVISGNPSDAQLDQNQCRAQSFSTDEVLSGDGVTTVFTISKPNVLSLWRTVGVVARIGVAYQFPNRFNLENAPQDVCGTDYTVRDISNGGPGTSIYCKTFSVTITGGSNLAVASTSLASVPTGVSLQLISDHGLDPQSMITNINTGTNTFTLSQPSTLDSGVSQTLTMMVTQVDILHDGCSGVTNPCGSTIQITFAVPPPAGTNNVTLQWYDPTGGIAYDCVNCSDYITVKPTYIGGYYTAVRYIGKAFGGIHADINYLEFTNQLAEILDQQSATQIDLHKTINYIMPGPFAGAPGGQVTPWYIDALANSVVVNYNNNRYDYNGAGKQTGIFGFSALSGIGNLFPVGPLHVNYTTLSLTAANTIVCKPGTIQDTWSASTLGINIIGAGDSTFALKTAIYANDYSTGRPGYLMASSAGNIIGAVTGIQSSGAMTNYVGSPSTPYWFCGLWTFVTAPTVSNIFTGGANTTASDGTIFLGGTAAVIVSGTAIQGVATTAGSSPYANGFPLSLQGLTSRVSTVPQFFYTAQATSQP